MHWTGRWKRLGMALGLGVGGCHQSTGAANDGTGSGGPGTTSAAATSTGGPASTSTGGPATTAATTTATTAAGSSSGPPKPPIEFDLGSIPDAPDVQQHGCAGIDFLFVIDDSGSMGAQQVRLLNSFNGFIDAIQNSLDNVSSYHVGVITSDAYAGNAPGCTELGDLVSQTQGFDAGNQVCTPFAEGYRFATDADDISVKFPCMAQVGTGGSYLELTVSGLIAALDPAKAQPGGCNEGFIRDDAILVVVIVTDDPPIPSDMDDANLLTDTTSWYPSVIAAKNDDPTALVMIGFVPYDDVSCTFAESPNLIGFVQAFGDQGVLASVCLDDYGPVFASTVETIQTTCKNYVPG